MGTSRGLDTAGYIAREGALEKVTEPYRPVVAAARERLVEVYGDRLHSGYLYGSIARGTAVPYRADLDLLAVLREEPTDADRADADTVQKALEAAYPQLNGGGVLTMSVTTALSEVERHDLGFFVACLCTPLVGPDLATGLPRYRPTVELARDTNGDLAEALDRFRADTGPPARLCRGAARKIVRTGFTLVMPRWGGWTSDLELSAELCGRHYPERAERLRRAAVLAHDPVDDPDAIAMLLDDLGPWLAAEYARTIGVRTPR
ncbi:MAG: nucleotidyltransferase domain-containing protein [Micromonosporaceae bacterium]